ncbi:spermatogenesis-associated protein 48 [Xenopus laevis]|uniref:Spermatogenesis-associated protein 48 n=1 Tax=Xenopus laevis TaxID=8355 RepID=A0A8J1KXL2_XENLA|nr:spermatogenesis-associated protein 48 [Xenopus laevis]XP_041422046.1 spermatogenesis-associated protein 48 [Xenopus laevis]
MAQSKERAQLVGQWDESRRLGRGECRKTSQCAVNPMPPQATPYVVRRDELEPDPDYNHFLLRTSTCWNSVARSDAALRAILRGSASKRTPPQKGHGPNSSLSQTFVFNVAKDSDDVSNESWRDAMARKFMFTSSTQSAYEEVPWDCKLPAKLSPPESALQMKSRSVSASFAHMSQTEPWQVSGRTWDRFQTRKLYTGTRPITFMSRFPRMDQIPNYNGCAGSRNSEDIDNGNAEYAPFTKVRTQQPHYYESAYSPNIPGYTGRVHWMAIHPANSNLRSPPSSANTQMIGSPLPSEAASSVRHQAPFSRMVTTVAPYNPFNKSNKVEIFA